MRPFLIVLGLTAMAMPAAAQQLGDAKVAVDVPGVSFTRALNGAEKTAKVENGTLVLRSEAKRDNFRDPDGKLSNSTAPVLLTEIDNTKPFTFVARVRPQFHATYDAGTFYIWVRDDLWLKMAIEQDERGKVRIVTVRTNDTSDDNNHDVVTRDGAYLKISSDTRTVGFYYSTDKTSWQLVRLFKNDYPQKIWTGVSAQSPVGEGTQAAFDEISLTAESIKDFRLGQ